MPSMRRLRFSADRRAWGPRIVRCRRIEDRGPWAFFSVALDAMSGSTGVTKILANPLAVWVEQGRLGKPTVDPFWRKELL
jgi:hypothetical protein